MRIPRGTSNGDSNNNNVNTRNYSNKSWAELKDEGKTHYQNRRYEQALECYRAALLCRGISDYDQQMLLSNIVACRLKIGTRAQAEVALVDARKCISLNERWSKGHVRLASVYIALNRSNDACNSLQRALTLDPSNQTARSMLTSELRRERVGANASEAVEEETSNDDLDDNPLPFWEKVQLVAGWYYERLYIWQSNLSDDTRSFLQVCAILIILYVLLGGRFGLASSGSNRGNYEHGNAYDQFYNSISSTNSRRTNTYNTYSSHHDTYTPYHHSSSHYMPSSSMSHLDLTNIFPMLLVFAAMYVAHKYGGIHPFQALWVMNMLNGRRGMRFGGMGWGGGGFGGYYGGPRYGARRHGFRRW